MIFENLASLTLPEGNVEEIMMGGTPLWSVSPVPRGYTLINYIESNGTQYIDTGFQQNNNTRLVMDAQVTQQPVSSVALNNTNISNFFTVTNGSRTWNRSNSGGGLGLKPANIGVHSSTATITLTAKVALTGVVIKGAYTTENSYDKVTLTVAGSTILNSASGTSSNAQRWSGSIAAGKTIVLTYAKDGSVNATGETVSFTITCNALSVPSTEHRWLFDGRINYDNASKNLFLINGTTWTAYYNTNSTKITLSDTGMLDRLFIDYNKNTINVNDFTYTWPEEEFQSTCNLTLLACNTAGTISAQSYAKLYSCKLYDNDILIRDFYPCIRNEDNAIGLWDRVNKQFYDNAGTGKFIAGLPVKSPLPTEYKPLEYIESSGTQYIDTGLKASSTNFRVTMYFELSANLNGKSLFGSQASSNYSIIPYSIPGFYVGTKANVLTHTLNTNTNTYLDAHANNGTFTLLMNGTTTSATYTGTLENTLNTFICANNLNGTASQFSSIRIKNIKFYKDDVLVRDFIPCVNVEETIGLYDLVDKIFYTNAGTGTFIAGPEIL